MLQFVKQAKINFPVWLGATTENMRLFGVGPGLPATVIIGADGKIAALHYSVIKQTDLRERIRSALARQFDCAREGDGRCETKHAECLAGAKLTALTRRGPRRERGSKPNRVQVDSGRSPAHESNSTAPPCALRPPIRFIRDCSLALNTIHAPANLHR